MSTTGWIVLGVLVVIVIWAISIYNSLVAMRQRTDQAFADIDVQLKQRHDLIPNLVETVKGYAAHERGTLEAVVQARNAAVAAPGVEQKVAAENMLTGALRQLFAVAEAYPDLKANQNFQQLQGELGRHREQARRLAPLLQQCGAGIQYRHPAVPGGSVRRHVRLLGQDLLRSRRAARRARPGAEREVLDCDRAAGAHRTS